MFLFTWVSTCVCVCVCWGILPLNFVDEIGCRVSVNTTGGAHTASMQLMMWRQVLLLMATPIITVGSTRKLQGIKDAGSIDDFGRVKFLQTQLRELARELSIPLHTLGRVVVPNCTDGQNTHLHSVICRMVSGSPMSAWEKQALHKSIWVVRSNPYTAQCLSNKPATQFDMSASKPPAHAGQCSTLPHTHTHT